MRIRVRHPSRREVLVGLSLLGFVAAGLFAGNWFNSQVTIRSASIYGVVLPSKFSTTKATIYIFAATPKSSYNGYMNTTSTSPGLEVLPDGNSSFMVRLNSNLTNGSPEAFYITDIPVTQGVIIKNYTLLQPFPLTYATGTGAYGETPYILEVRLLASSPIGTISWESFNYYIGYHNNGLSDTRALTQEFSQLLFASLAVLLWALALKGVSKRSLPIWFPVGTLAFLCIVLFIYVFVGSTFEILNSSWSPSWARIFLPFSHQGFNHLSGNLPPFLIASTCLELTLRKFGRKPLYLLAFATPVMVDYLQGQIFSSAGVSVVLGTFSVTIWILIAFYKNELMQKVGLRWLLAAVVGSGLALSGVIVDYVGDLTVSLPLQNPFWLGEAFWHPLAITLEGLTVLLIFKWYSQGSLSRGATRVRSFLRRPVVGWAAPLTVLLAEFLWFSIFQLVPYKGPPQPVIPPITCASASQWVITSCNPSGQWTSFLVFDGWNNIGNLVFGVVTVIIFARRLPIKRGWLISGGLFLVTNLAGLISPSVIYAFPPSPFGSWGLSSATFAPVGFAAAVSVYAFVGELRLGSEGLRQSRLITYLSMGWFLFSVGLMSFTANSSPIVEAVHVTSIGIGLLGGLLILGIIYFKEHRQAAITQDN